MPNVFQNQVDASVRKLADEQAAGHTTIIAAALALEKYAAETLNEKASVQGFTVALGAINEAVDKLTQRIAMKATERLGYPVSKNATYSVSGSTLAELAQMALDICVAQIDARASQTSNPRLTPPPQ